MPLRESSSKMQACRGSQQEVRKYFENILIKSDIEHKLDTAIGGAQGTRGTALNVQLINWPKQALSRHSATERGVRMA